MTSSYEQVVELETRVEGMTLEQVEGRLTELDDASERRGLRGMECREMDTLAARWETLTGRRYL